MKKYFLWLSMSLLVSMYSFGMKPIELFVSADKTAVSKDKRKVTFATIKEALDASLKMKRKDANAEITINILKGNYHLTSPILLTPTLNGITIKGAGVDKVSVMGSIPLTLTWQKSDYNIYVATVPEGQDFDQLVVDGKAQILARYPNYDEEAYYWQGYAEDVISVERIASWEKPEGTYFHALHGGRWGGFHFQITGVNDDGTPVLDGGHQNNRGSKPHKEYRMVENVFEELDSPGEWYLDTGNNKLYYWPPKGVDLNKSTFEVSALKDLIQIVGTLESPVKDVTISGIKFENTRRTFMEEFEPLLRSDWMIYRGSVLFFEGTENCVVQSCEFTNLGGNVIMASKYNKGLQIKQNHIHECGASAVSFIGDPSAVRSPSFNYGKYVPLEEMDTLPGPQNDLYPRECLVDDNLIYRIGRIEKQTAGVQIAMAMDITVSNNSIYDVPRAGINIGDGTWGGHILEYNDVFNTVLETSDHGSFNSWGRDRFWHPKRNIMNDITTENPDMPLWDAIHKTIIRNNRFRCDHGWDIDLDDGSTNYHIYNNLCLNSGIKLREGFHRVVENNIMVNNSLHPHVWFAKSEDIVKNNIVGRSYQDVGLLGWGKEMDYNFFPNEVTMMKSQIYGRDIHSAFGDPMFKDPENMDFSVAENSPALEIGFVNFPMDQFGVKNPALKALAKTPEIPEIKDPSEGGNESSSQVAWLRNNIKSVESEQEQSAYGLNTQEGVIVLKVWINSPAVKNDGLEKGDVILEVGGKKIKDVREFLTITRSYQETGSMSIIVMRDQSEQALTIKIK